MEGEQRSPYSYVTLRVVPRIERGECFNAGVVVFSRSRRYLDARVGLHEQKLAALAPGADAEVIQKQLAALVAIAHGDEDAGPVARMSLAERFHWLAAPSSTMIQPSAAHTGLTVDPAATIDRLFYSLVGD